MGAVETENGLESQGMVNNDNIQTCTFYLWHWLILGCKAAFPVKRSMSIRPTFVVMRKNNGSVLL